MTPIVLTSVNPDGTKTKLLVSQHFYAVPVEPTAHESWGKSIVVLSHTASFSVAETIDEIANLCDARRNR